MPLRRRAACDQGARWEPVPTPSRQGTGVEGSAEAGVGL